MSGETVRIHFHVTDESAIYELVYDLGDTSWALEEIGRFTEAIGLDRS